MMSQWWLCLLKEGFGDRLDNIIQRENQNPVDEFNKQMNQKKKEVKV